DNENEFRDIEEEVIKQLSKKSNVVIATGGGVIKRNINIERLKQNGKIVFIDRNVELLMATTSRPLSSSLDALKHLYKERYRLYKEAADVSIENNDELFDAVNKIKNEA
ncbi:MAG: shikimate kinase, partial [Bacilli bacterium]|nr:shikimate kinase [Bacilli bacterium]